MRMKENHMKDGQLKPGYNIQIAVESDFIVDVYVSSERSDQLTLIPFLDRLKSNLKVKYESVTADVRYESAEKYSYLESKNQKMFIKPQTYEKSKTKKFEENISKRENMEYYADGDFYICTAGEKLSVVGTKNRKFKSGFNFLITIYQCENCCNYANKAKGNK